jgi:tetratricopeptide (TPR) repeat protein
LLSCLFAWTLSSASLASPVAHAGDDGSQLVSLSSLRAQQGQPAAPPSGNATAAPQKGPTPRERRAQAYAKLLEGQRYLSRTRAGTLRLSALRTAQEAFQQAATLDPTLAEAHTALAEIAFLMQDVDKAEASAATAARIDRDNFGAHRILSRIHALKSGVFDNRLERARAEQAISELKEVVRLDANDPEGLALLGELYLATGRNEEAVDAFRRWTAAPAPLDSRFYEAITQGRELTPDAANARLGEALLRLGRTVEAVEAIRRAIALEPGNIGYLELLSRTVEAGGDASKQQAVLAELERVVAANPSNSAAVGLLARTQARAGRTDEAVATLRAGLAQLKSTNQREQMTLRAELAQIFSDALRFDEAVAVYEELLKERGIGSEPLTSDNDKRFATLVLDRIVGLRRQAGQPEATLAAIERMRRLLGQSDPSADLQYVIHLRDQGRREEALEAIRQARTRFPEHVGFLRLEAATLADLGRIDEAASLLRARLKGDAEDYNEYLALANLYMGAGRGREAVEAARKALDLAPPERPELVTQALIMLSSAQERAGDARGSEETLRRILSKEPDNPTALNNLGYFLVERGERLNEALEMIQRAVRAEPNNASFQDSLGWAHFKLGQLEEAERYLSEAARRSPASATIQEHLGDVYQRRGKSQQAQSAWRKALSLSTEASDSARIKAKLGGTTNK